MPWRRPRTSYRKKGLGLRTRHSRGPRVRAKPGWYKSPSAGRVYLHSSCERQLARMLDSHKIKWVRPTLGIPYADASGKLHKYYPDFYLIELKAWIEVKWLPIGNDIIKINALKLAMPSDKIAMVQFGRPDHRAAVRSGMIGALLKKGGSW